jgi:hypothetical protein
MAGVLPLVLRAEQRGTRAAVDNPGWFPFTSDEIDLGRSMVTAWGSFATVRPCPSVRRC